MLFNNLVCCSRLEADKDPLLIINFSCQETQSSLRNQTTSLFVFPIMPTTHSASNSAPMRTFLSLLHMFFLAFWSLTLHLFGVFPGFSNVFLDCLRLFPRISACFSIPFRPTHLFARQVALQVSLPEIDGAIEPLIFSGRDGTSGRSIPMQELKRRFIYFFFVWLFFIFIFPPLFFFFFRVGLFFSV